MENTTKAETAAISEALSTCLQAQRAAYHRKRNPSYDERMADLKALQRFLRENQEAICQAINQDFGCRSRFETMLVELLGQQGGVRHAMKHLRTWMRPHKRHLSPIQFFSAEGRVVPQPLGVVGIVVPWNFPITLSFGPLVCALAAGNRAMVKMSEHSAHLARLLVQQMPKYLPEDKVQFFSDSEGLGPAFSSLPFDHLFFTGSSATGKAVMANCAKNLTPVTLELGGKSPAIVAPDYPVQKAAERIMWAKMLNSGQVCTNVDYLYLPADKIDSFVAHARVFLRKHYADFNSGDVTSIINQEAYVRLQAMLEDAKQKGATVINLCEGQVLDTSKRIMAAHIVVGATDAMQLMQREIFGPVLPIKNYQNKEEICANLDAQARPLALYVYTEDRTLADWYIQNTMSGGVCINDSMLHAAQDDLPFGGVGASGMGHYHGYEGFVTFSKMRPIFHQGPIRAMNAMLPPYKGLSSVILKLLMRLKG